MYSRCHRFLLTMISILGSRKQKEFIRSRLLQNYDALSKNIHIWIHASSVGEVNLLEQFLQTCLENFEGDILLTVFTDTGRETALQNMEKRKEFIFYIFLWMIKHPFRRFWIRFPCKIYTLSKRSFGPISSLFVIKRREWLWSMVEFPAKVFDVIKNKISIKSSVTENRKFLCAN